MSINQLNPSLASHHAQIIDQLAAYLRLDVSMLKKNVQARRQSFEHFLRGKLHAFV